MAPIHVFLFAFALATPDPAELHQHVQSARAALQTGELELEVREDAAGEAGRVIATYHCWFDKTRIRSDLKQPRSGPDLDVGVEIRRILTPDELLSHSNSISRGLPLSPRIDYKQAIATLEANHSIRILDPRSIGLYVVPHGVLSRMRGEKLRFNPELAVPLGVFEDTLFGTKCWRVDVTTQETGGGKGSYWICPEMGHNMVRGVVTSNFRSQSLVDSIDCKLREYGDSRIWFPEEVRFRRQVDGKTVMSETLTVTTARLNVHVDEKEFTLAAFGLPKGLEVLENPPNPSGSRLWDGEKLIKYSSDSRGIGATGAAVIQPDRRWLRVVSLNLGLVGALCLGIYVLRRRFVH